MKKLSDEEKVLDYIIKLLNGKSTNQCYIYNTIIVATELSEQEIMQSMHFLQSDNLIRIIKISPNNDFSSPCLVELTSQGKHYFDNKKLNKVSNRRSWIQTYIPNITATIAIIISIIAIIISIWMT